MKTTQERINALQLAGFFHNRQGYNVAPRYSSGSPALVDRNTALHVAQQEHEQYQAHLEGLYGTAQQERAKTLGLDGIVESRLEKSNSRGWRVYDVLTGKTFDRAART